MKIIYHYGCLAYLFCREYIYRTVNIKNTCEQHAISMRVAVQCVSSCTLYEVVMQHKVVLGVSQIQLPSCKQCLLMEQGHCPFSV